MSSVVTDTEDNVLLVLLSNSGMFVVSSFVYTLLKNWLKTSTFSASFLVSVPSCFSRFGTFSLVFVFEDIYWNRALGFDFASFATFFSFSLFAFLTSLLTRFLYFTYSASLMSDRYFFFLAKAALFSCKALSKVTGAVSSAHWVVLFY